MLEGIYMILHQSKSHFAGREQQVCWSGGSNGEPEGLQDEARCVGQGGGRVGVGGEEWGPLPSYGISCCANMHTYHA